MKNSNLNFKPSKKRRVRRQSTKSRKVVKARNLKPIIAISCACLAVVAVAVIWGSVLGERADKYAEMQSEGRWTLGEDDVAPLPSGVPVTLSSPLSPSQTVWDIKSYGDRAAGGVTLDVYSDGTPNYYSDVGIAAGLSNSDMYSLSKKVAAMHSESIRVTCTFYVTSLAATPAGVDAAVQSYRRGIELAMLEEFALSGMDEILLLGCPVDTDNTDGGNTRTIEFLRELTQRLSTADPDSPPTVGVALPIEMIDGIYHGDTSAATILAYCDFIAMDMQNSEDYPLYGGSDLDYEQGADTDDGENFSPLSDMLSRFTYAYQKYQLRLLFNSEQTSGITTAISHGFYNISVIK
ncbi:MAG: hypothetical protein E7589_02665 [Ruminococcaceae bacterium]|nr:hypothetical protein [Oscillospiraceae bacterium]